MDWRTVLGGISVILGMVGSIVGIGYYLLTYADSTQFFNNLIMLILLLCVLFGVLYFPEQGTEKRSSIVPRWSVNIFIGLLCLSTLYCLFLVGETFPRPSVTPVTPNNSGTETSTPPDKDNSDNSTSKDARSDTTQYRGSSPENTNPSTLQNNNSSPSQEVLVPDEIKPSNVGIPDDNSTVNNNASSNPNSNPTNNAVTTPENSEQTTCAPEGSGTSISNVSMKKSGDNYSVVISGRGFGYQSPYVGASEYIIIQDLTSHWEAGHDNGVEVNTVTVDVSTWNDQQIVIDGFRGDYNEHGYEFKPGDMIKVVVWTPNGGENDYSACDFTLK